MLFTLPNPKEVRDLLEGLLGRSVTVNTGAPLLADDLNHALVAVYTTDTRALRAVIAMDLPLAVYTGAALGLVPPGGAQDLVADKVLTSAIQENVQEVYNVMGALLNREGGPHLKLGEVIPPSAAPPPDARSVLLALGHRLDLNVEIAGYGNGRLALTLAP